MFEIDLGELKDTRVDNNVLSTVGRYSSIKQLNTNYKNPNGFTYGRILCFDCISARQTAMSKKNDEYYLAVSSDLRMWVGRRINKETAITWKEK